MNIVPINFINNGSYISHWKKGDKIHFSKYGGIELSVGGEDLMIIEETDVLAIIG